MAHHWHTNTAQLVSDHSLYVGGMIQDRQTGNWHFLAFHNEGRRVRSSGDISDPMTAHWDGDRLELTEELAVNQPAESGAPVATPANHCVNV